MTNSPPLATPATNYARISALLTDYSAAARENGRKERDDEIEALQARLKECDQYNLKDTAQLDEVRTALRAFNLSTARPGEAVRLALAERKNAMTDAANKQAGLDAVRDALVAAGQESGTLTARIKAIAVTRDEAIATLSTAQEQVETLQAQLAEAKAEIERLRKARKPNPETVATVESIPGYQEMIDAFDWQAKPHELTRQEFWTRAAAQAVKSMVEVMDEYGIPARLPGAKLDIPRPADRLKYFLADTIAAKTA
jgi:chaperonin cofactor prefoldin